MPGDARGLAGLGLALLAGCSLVAGAGAEDARPVDDVQAAWAAVHEDYPFLAFKEIPWDELRAGWVARAAALRGDGENPLLSEMMATLQDGHVAILPRGGGLPVRPWLPGRMVADRARYRPEVVRSYLPLELLPDGRVEWGITPDGVGYVYLGTFEDGTWAYELDAVLDALRGARALVVDVRNNEGGSTTPADLFLGRFLPADVAAPGLYEHGQPLAPWTIRARGPFTWTKPVVLLVNGVTFSAAEYFALVLGERPNVTLVGGTTGGGGGGYRYYRLPSGTLLRLPYKGFRRYDGEELEWNGVPPDVAVAQDDGHLAAGRDDQLEAALAIARGP